MTVQAMEMRPGARRGGIAVLGTAGSRRWAAGRGTDARRGGAGDGAAGRRRPSMRSGQKWPLPGPDSGHV